MHLVLDHQSEVLKDALEGHNERNPETYGGPVETLVLVLNASSFHPLRNLTTVALGHSVASAHPLPGHLT